MTFFRRKNFLHTLNCNFKGWILIFQRKTRCLLMKLRVWENFVYINYLKFWNNFPMMRNCFKCFDYTRLTPNNRSVYISFVIEFRSCWQSVIIRFLARGGIYSQKKVSSHFEIRKNKKKWKHFLTSITQKANWISLIIYSRWNLNTHDKYMYSEANL